MKYFFTATVCALSVICVAQKTVDVDKTEGFPQNSFYSVGGEPFVNVKFVRLTSGTPYFKDEWLKGTGVSGTGVVYKAGILKLDLFDNEVHFLDAAGNEMITTSPLKEIILTDTITGSTYHFIHSSLFPSSQKSRQGWYLQLATGHASLYQFFLKIVSENRPYGSATTEQTITTKDEFYIYHNAAFQQVKKPKDLLDVLNDNKLELENFLKKSSKHNSLAEQLISLTEFYNSLQ